MQRKYYNVAIDLIYSHTEVNSSRIPNNDRLSVERVSKAIFR